MKSVLSPKVDRLQPSSTMAVGAAVEELKEQGVEDILSLGVGEPCFDTPKNIKEATCKALMEGKTKYQPTAGDPELRREICKKLSRENDIQVDHDQILVTIGGKLGIYLTLQALLSEGDKLVLIDPAWVSYEPAARLMGADVIRVPSRPKDGFRPDLEALKDAMDSSVKLVLINSPSNPTGLVYEESTIREIVELAMDWESFVLSDEVYEHLIYEGEHYSPAADYENVITVNAFSKTYAMTGWRLGYATGPAEVVEGMIKIQQHSATCVNAFSQAGAIEALRSEESKSAAQSMKENYRERRKLMMDLIAESSIFSLEANPEGAFYCFPSYKPDRPSLSFAKELLEEVHVATVPGSGFGTCGEGHLRLSYSTEEEKMIAAFDRMEEYYSKNYT